MRKALKVLGIVVIAIMGLVLLAVAAASAVYTPEYVYRVLAWRESDSFDWQKFPLHPLDPAPTAYHFEEAPDPRVKTLFEEISGAEDWDAFLAETDTQAFIVVQDGKVVYENYFNDTQRDSIVTSFSMAKSFTSALIGKAIEERFIKSVDDPITDYLPELAERDPRFNDITIRHLLLMAAGFEYVPFRAFLFNGDDPLSTYYPDQRKISLENTHIIEPPGAHFNYNKYHPQLLGMILERATGMPVTQYLQTRFWDPLGMEYGGSWSTDSVASDFEKMETGVNARAIDFAKFGTLFLNGGEWQGQQVLSKAWVDESTGPLLPESYDDYYTRYDDFIKTMPGQGFYKYLWWGMAREDGAYDFTAGGDRGQYIYVSPEKDLIIVRNGIDWGISSQEWLRLFYDFASQY